MSNPKEKHYWSTLRHSLTSGSWTSATPAKAYNGTPISWSELFRKFNKHCPGYGEVVEVASQTQAIALLVAGGVKDEDLDGEDGEGLDLGEECVVDDGRRDEARVAYEALKSYGGSEQPSDSRHQALAYAAYALTFYTESLSHLSAVRDLAEAQSRLQPLQFIRSVATSAATGTSSTTGNETSGSSFVTNGFTSSFVSLDTAGGEAASIAEISNGNTWAAAEVIRSLAHFTHSEAPITVNTRNPARHSLSFFNSTTMISPVQLADKTVTLESNCLVYSINALSRLSAHMD